MIIMLNQREGNIQNWSMYCRPNFYRDVNKQSFIPMRDRTELRDSLRRIDKNIFSSKKNYHTSSRQFYLKMFITVASLPNSQQLFKKLTERAVRYAEKIKNKCEEQLRILKSIQPLKNLREIIVERQKQIDKIAALYQLLRYLRFQNEIDSWQIHKFYKKMNNSDGYTHQKRQRIDQLINQYNVQKMKKDEKIQREVKHFIQQFQQTLHKCGVLIQKKI